VIKVSNEAADKIKQLQNEDTDKSGYLRVRVVKGGCSGMSYKLDFERTDPKPEDQLYDDNGVRVVVDQDSIQYVDGMTLNYSGGLNGTGFEFSNPDANRTCGCGTSFAI